MTNINNVSQTKPKRNNTSGRLGVLSRLWPSASNCQAMDPTAQMIEDWGLELADQKLAEAKRWLENVVDNILA